MAFTSRREKRQQSRIEKNTRKHQSWSRHQKSQNDARKSKQSTIPTSKETKIANDARKQKRSISSNEANSRVHQIDQLSTLPKENKVESYLGSHTSGVEKIKEKKFSKKRKLGNEKVKETYGIGMPDLSTSTKADLELERKLAKKLRVKDGKLRGEDDGLNMFLEGLTSVSEFLGEDEATAGVELASKRSKKSSINKKHKMEELTKPRLRAENLDDLNVEIPKPGESSNLEVALTDFTSGAHSEKKHKKRKLLEQKQESDMVDGGTADSLSEPMDSSGMDVAPEENFTPVPVMKMNEKYVPPHFRSLSGSESEEYQLRRCIKGLLGNRLSVLNVESITGEMSSIFHSVARSVATKIMSEEILTSCSEGARGNEQNAAAFAAFVAGMACLVGIDFSAKFLASFAKHFEDEYRKEDNISLRNFTLLLSYLFKFGVCSSDLIYDFVIMLSKQLTEIDVSTILAILQCCGMKMRADDPGAMKSFIHSIRGRVSELKGSSGDDQGKINTKRMDFMLETICNIKNNKERPEEDPVHYTRIKKWLQKLRVDEIELIGLKWSILLDPNKKGQWWLSGNVVSTKDNIEEVASTIDKDTIETQKFLKIAAAQRMNTDTRRAIFCIIISGEDYIDAFEKLLRLDLPGKQDREIMRVLVKCCSQEKVFNKYYSILASKLCEHDKNHKFTLQFCIWDHFKELESMPLLSSMNLAKFVAEMISSFTLSLAVLKTVEFGHARLMTPKRIMHFRILFESIFKYPENLVWNIFTRVAIGPELENLREGMEYFIKEHVVKSNKALNQIFKTVKKALNNAQGILM